MRIFSLLILIISLGFASGCGVYSFTGASISPDVKTISIGTFYNNAPLGPSNMSVLFTENIKDYFQQNTSLDLVDNNGDLQIEGYISNYTITPVAATVGAQGQADFSALSRITITISASYTNVNDPTFDFDRSFSFFKDFDNSANLAAQEEAFVEEIFDQIVLDIFNASVANW
ncbi:LPS assembly lipoprotein LptE [Ekhidna sp.]|uniref:LPS assembly lipoprotein LptE n=1 Tax=Ekhidna sp. TaxID=2608089 RepID=UPI003B51213C